MCTNPNDALARSVTTWQSQQRVQEAGGFTWNNINCMLTDEAGYGGSPVDLDPCGLTKAEGYPRANNSENAPPKAAKISDAKKECAAWLSIACQPESILPKIPMLTSFTRNDDGRQFPLPSPIQDIAFHMLIRGRYAWMGYGWLGCTADYERPDALGYDYGEPVDPTCSETRPGSGVFTRTWTKSVVTMDCNTWTPNITLAGHDGPIPVPKPPPPPPAPPPAPAVPCKANPVSGYNCSLHRCSSDGSPARGHCGNDLCYPKVSLPSLCSPLPDTLLEAAAEAKRRCDGYQLCHSFGIDEDKYDQAGGKVNPACHVTPSSCYKFFQSGYAATNSVKDGWTMWVQQDTQQGHHDVQVPGNGASSCSGEVAAAYVNTKVGMECGTSDPSGAGTFASSCVMLCTGSSVTILLVRLLEKIRPNQRPNC